MEAKSISSKTVSEYAVTVKGDADGPKFKKIHTFKVK